MNEKIIEVYKRLVREEKIQSQQDFADQLGYNKGTISEILNGKKAASRPLIKKFEEVFGKFKTPDENMIVDGPTNGNSGKENQHEHYNVRLKNERSGKIVMPKDVKKEDIQIFIEYLKLMLKSME